MHMYISTFACVRIVLLSCTNTYYYSCKICISTRKQNNDLLKVSSICQCKPMDRNKNSHCDDVCTFHNLWMMKGHMAR